MYFLFMMFDDQKVKLLGVGRSISYGRSVFPRKINPGENLRGGDQFSTVGSVFPGKIDPGDPKISIPRINFA